VTEIIPSRRVTTFAPCKVNLTLDVFPPRSDGFHDLDSVVYPCRPADELQIAVNPGLRTIPFTCSDATLPTDGGNLAYRAAALVLERLWPNAAVDISIRLTKNLPHQAGLGGGSSDAAVVLRALDPNHPALPELAAELGSDVPLFLRDGVSRMQGRGERLETVAIQPRLYGVIVKPTVGVPTGPAYRLLDALPNRVPGSATERLLAVLPSGEMTAIAAAMGNDFEAAVLPAYPEVAAAHETVTAAGALRTLLCGSGSAIFGLARDREHAEQIADSLRGKFPFVEKAEPL
jgi:4-diphosphocytidyl-2-C-methyl-D-erythritol kinase